MYMCERERDYTTDICCSHNLYKDLGVFCYNCRLIAFQYSLPSRLLLSDPVLDMLKIVRNLACCELNYHT